MRKSLIPAILLAFLVQTSIGQVVLVGESERITNEPNSGVYNPGTAFFKENFETVAIPGLPSGWTDFTSGTDAGFYTGTAGNGIGQANENGFWPVPAHSRFVMTNDDLCNCNKSGDYLQLPDLNFSNKTDMYLTFEAYHDGSGGGEATVSVSINGGGFNTILVLPASLNWKHYCVPLSGTDNQAQIQLRFNYSDNGNYGSGLALDNIAVDKLPQNDISLNEVYFNGSQDISGTSYYTMIPHRHARADTLNFAGRLTNAGINAQTNTELNVTVTGALNYDESGFIGILQQGVTDTIEILNSTFSPAATGNYQVKFEVSSDMIDNDPSNNLSSLSFNVSDTTYARDNGFFNGSGIWYGNINYEYGSVFEINATDTLTSFSAYFHASTTHGSVVRFKVYSLANLNTPVYTSPLETLAVNRINKWVTFSHPEEPLAVGDYLGVFEAIDGNVVIAINTLQKTPTNASRINITGWAPAPYTPFLRLNFKPFNDPCPVIISHTITPIACAGDTNGMIEVIPSGHSGPFQYQWSTGDTSSTIDSLKEGFYSLTVTYDVGCTSVTSYQLNEPDTLTSNLVITDENCGDMGGSITPIIGGGTAPYQFLWNTNSQNAQLSGLSVGMYSFTVTDANGCMHLDSAQVNGTPGVESNFTLFNPFCGVSNGSISSNPTSGPAPYSYAWSHDTITTSAANSLVAGIYHVTITDSNNCSRNFPIFLNNDGAPAISTDSISNASCAGSNDGDIWISETGGTSPYTYAWSDGASTTSQDLTNAVEGIYFVTVTDSNGCLSFHTDTILSPDSLKAVIEFISPLCYGDSNGIINLFPAGGTPEYNYSWSSGDTTSSISNLPEGLYSITVTDGNNCTVTASQFLSQPDSISIFVIQTIGDDTLAGGQGAVDIELIGGNAPYTYLWSNGAGSQDISDLEGGAYFVTVSDINNCTKVQRAFVDFPLGVEDFRLPGSHNLTLYPNPSNGIVRINFHNESGRNYRIYIYNAQGTTLYSQEVYAEPDGSIQLDISHLSSGLYLFKAQAENSISISRLILE